LPIDQQLQLLLHLQRAVCQLAQAQAGTRNVCLRLLNQDQFKM
jgi:hypothetical protein